MHRINNASLGISDIPGFAGGPEDALDKVKMGEGVHVDEEVIIDHRI